MTRSGFVETVTDMGGQHIVNDHIDPILGFHYRTVHSLTACRVLVITPDRSMFSLVLRCKQSALVPGDLLTWVEEGTGVPSPDPRWKGSVLVEPSRASLLDEHWFVPHLVPIRRV